MSNTTILLECCPNNELFLKENAIKLSMGREKVKIREACIKAPERLIKISGVPIKVRKGKTTGE